MSFIVTRVNEEHGVIGMYLVERTLNVFVRNLGAILDRRQGYRYKRQKFDAQPSDALTFP